MKKVAFILIGLLIPTAAYGQEDTDVPDPVPTMDKRVVSTTLDVGVRTTYVRESGFDPYSQNDALVQGTFGATRTIVVRWPFSIAVGGRWDFGGTSSTARGAETNLGVHRLLAPVEGRFHFGGRDGYFFARVAPGAVRMSASVKDASLDTPMGVTAWTPALDASVGYAWLMGPRSRPELHRARFWLLPEVGYAWSGSLPMVMGPSVAADDPRQFGSLTMPSLALRGPFFRVGAGLSF